MSVTSLSIIHLTLKNVMNFLKCFTEIKIHCQSGDIILSIKQRRNGVEEGFSSIQSLSRIRLFATSWTAAHQASLSIINTWSLLKFISIASVMPSNYLILCRPLLLPPSIFPSIRVFSNESVLRIRWPKYWSFSFNISPSNEYSGLISFTMDWLDLLAVRGTLKVFSNTTVQKHQFFGTQLSL